MSKPLTLHGDVHECGRTPCEAFGLTDSVHDELLCVILSGSDMWSVDFCLT